jgi:hypothetical protein
MHNRLAHWTLPSILVTTLFSATMITAQPQFTINEVPGTTTSTGTQVLFSPQGVAVDWKGTAYFVSSLANSTGIHTLPLRQPSEHVRRLECRRGKRGGSNCIHKSHRNLCPTGHRRGGRGGQPGQPLLHTGRRRDLPRHGWVHISGNAEYPEPECGRRGQCRKPVLRGAL